MSNDDDPTVPGLVPSRRRTVKVCPTCLGNGTLPLDAHPFGSVIHRLERIALKLDGKKDKLSTGISDDVESLLKSLGVDRDAGQA